MIIKKKKKTTTFDAPHVDNIPSQTLTGHVKPKLKRIGLVKLSALVSGTWKELEPRTGVTVPP